jgi:bacterioferritin
LGIGPLLESDTHDVGNMLRESLEHETLARGAYCRLLETVAGKSVLLEEYARELIVDEELHADEVNKMLRRPGDTNAFQA